MIADQLKELGFKHSDDFGQCKFDKAWIGRCKNPAIDENGLCKDHKHMVCVSCGKPATRECGENRSIRMWCSSL